MNALGIKCATSYLHSLHRQGNKQLKNDDATTTELPLGNFLCVSAAFSQYVAHSTSASDR